MTNLSELKNAWDHLAEQDALGAILTDPTKTDRRWNLDEFMATGEAEIKTVMRHLARIDLLPKSSGKALDFGCGVGRLTQAMSRRFASCVGVDISTQMIEAAESLNKHEHCRYVAVPGPRLPFDDGFFAFIYSNIVLQHVPRRYAIGYLHEFERLLIPGGILVFGVQDRFVSPSFSSRVERIRHILHLRSRIRALLGTSRGDMLMHCLPEHAIQGALQSMKIVDIRLTNTAAKDFNGQLEYLCNEPIRGYVGKQYCAVRT